MPKNKVSGTFNVLQHILNNTQGKITHYFIKNIYLWVCIGYSCSAMLK